MSAFFKRLTTLLESKGLFISTLVFFVFQSVWIALSAVYPQAFDENFHFGIIKLYAGHWSPFLTNQPAGGDQYGALARDPSYLYHYLMSFPYRFFHFFTDNQTILVIALRLIDVALFTSGLLLFRRLLVRAKLSRALTNIVLLLFTLIPIVPQLAAHINYDNLLLPLTAWSCLLALDVLDEIQARKPNIRSMVLLSVVGLGAGIVKYAYLPIFAAIVVFLLFATWRQMKNNVRRTQLRKALKQSWADQSLLMKIALVAGFAVAFGLFFQRDGINLMRYHTVTPDCSRILSEHACSQYSVWSADTAWHTALLQQPTVSFENPVVYFASWLYWVWYRLFFAVNGPNSGFTNYPPLPLPSAAALAIAGTGTVLAIIWHRRIFADKYLSFFLLVGLFYILALLVTGWEDYHYTNVLVDMNGRYLLPVLLPLGAIVARAFSIALRHAPKVHKTVLASAAILLFLQGGGFITFLSRSDASWDWPNGTVVKVNNAARNVTKPVILHTGKNYNTKYWLFN